MCRPPFASRPRFPVRRGTRHKGEGVLRSVTDFNDGWMFDGHTPVRLPHTAVELPFSYFDETAYQRAFTYSKVFRADPNWAGREITVQFDGAMANAKVRLNGVEIASHADGYTPFDARLTGLLQDGENRIEVEIDGSENPAIPPFGGQIDYLTYAGIYRDVWLRVSAPVSIGSHKIETPNPLADTKSVRIVTTLDNPRGLNVTGTLTAVLRDANARNCASVEIAVGDDVDEIVLDMTSLEGIALWDINAPTLYTLDLTLDTHHGTDTVSTRFGFRRAEFKPEGFFLNGRRLQLRGLNRHQSFPYAGYALGKAAQERDADILKDELRLNLVRTSHYPQSSWFLDRCDEIGLLVFEEIPGWQHIGDTAWKAASVDNVRAMVRRDWNHPCVILWGVRINESHDDHDFYVETNRVARALDPTRQTAGVRYIPETEFLEDVFAMNDFALDMSEMPQINTGRRPLRPVKETTGLDHPVPYLVTEYGGHMYPTKSYDQEQRQAEHVTRHLEVLNAAYGDPKISGSIGWCAFDYNTHKDFGSGDRICHHGVMDMFRAPKFAAHVYASQGDPAGGVVMEPVTYWARGERNIGGVMPLIILTNCDEVELRYAGGGAKRFVPARALYPHLPYAPVVIDHSNFSADEMGLWGMTWEDAELIGYVDGKPAATRRYVADPVPTRLQVLADADRIGATDAVRVMIRVLDQAGNTLPFHFDPVILSLDGPARLFGPTLAALRAGSTGTWVQATGAGQIDLSVTHPQLGTVMTTIVAGDV